MDYTTFLSYSRKEVPIIVSEPSPYYEAWLLIAKFFLFLAFAFIIADYAVARKTSDLLIKGFRYEI